MPLIFRGMLKDGDKPAVGPAGNSLGCRPGRDIPVEVGDVVRPGTGGMSVAPSWRALPGHRVPIRLSHLAPHAIGRNPRLSCWQMGSGPFVAGPLAQGLSLQIDPSDADHGLVEPEREMTLSQFQTALAATRDQWALIGEDQP